MALRREDLNPQTSGWSPAREAFGAEGSVVQFPTIAVRRRIARRRRVVIARRRAALAASLVILTGGFLLAGGPGASAPASRIGAPKAVVVQAGDTLWSISSRYAPDGIDPRAYVDALEQLNHLDGAPVAGMRLKLPR
jgi:Tfp pilus assembly protein FimV